MDNVYPVWTDTSVKIPLRLSGKEVLCFFFSTETLQDESLLINYPPWLICNRYGYPPASLTWRTAPQEVLLQPGSPVGTMFHWSQQWHHFSFISAAHPTMQQVIFLKSRTFVIVRYKDTHLSPNIMDSCRHCVHASWNHCSQRKHCNIFRYHLRGDGRKR